MHIFDLLNTMQSSIEISKLKVILSSQFPKFIYHSKLMIRNQGESFTYQQFKKLNFNLPLMNLTLKELYERKEEVDQKVTFTLKQFMN